MVHFDIGAAVVSGFSQIHRNFQNYRLTIATSFKTLTCLELVLGHCINVYGRPRASEQMLGAFAMSISVCIEIEEANNRFT